MAAYTMTQTDYISVTIHADFSGTPTSGNVPLLVQFTDLSLGVRMTLRVNV